MLGEAEAGLRVGWWLSLPDPQASIQETCPEAGTDQESLA